MKKEIHIFFTALMFYTRIPCPRNIDHNPDYLNKASRYFPLIGWIVGSVAFGIFWLFNYLLGPEIAVIFSMIASVLLTGAFHEDGFADVCDGFGGGWTKEKILMIMKDSAIGAYGAIGVVLLLLLKYHSLSRIVSSEIPNLNSEILIFILFVSAHSLSRLAAISIVFTHEYSREDATSKSKPSAKFFLARSGWRLPFRTTATCHLDLFSMAIRTSLSSSFLDPIFLSALFPEMD